PATPVDLGITLPGDSGGGGNPVTVTPVVSPAYSYFNQFFFFYLFDKPDLQNWLNDSQNSEVKQQIEDYINQPFSLIIGGPSQQEQKNQRFEFAEFASNALMEGGQVDFNLEVIIDQSFSNNTTLMNVFTQFGGLPTFQSYLQNFEGTFSVAHLKLAASSTLPDAVHAETDPPQNYVVTITFNTNHLDKPDLSIARTMMHEMIHAEIFRKLLSNYNHPSLNGITSDDIIAMKDDFPGIHDYYIRWIENIPAG